MNKHRFVVTFTVNEMDVINSALIQMPYYKVAPVIDEINRQISRQVPECNDDTKQPVVDAQPSFTEQEKFEPKPA